MIDRRIIEVNVELSTKEEVFSYLSSLVVSAGYAEDPQAVLAALKAREAEGTTGMMDGFAIPHAKSEAIHKPGIAVLKLARGVEWDSMDGQPARFIVALFIPESQAGATHLQLLSKLARLLMRQEFKNNFEAAGSYEAVADLLEKELV